LWVPNYLENNSKISLGHHLLRLIEPIRTSWHLPEKRAPARMLKRRMSAMNKEKHRLKEAIWEVSVDFAETCLPGPSVHTLHRFLCFAVGSVAAEGFLPAALQIKPLGAHAACPSSLQE